MKSVAALRARRFSEREARLWNYGNSEEFKDFFWPVRQWPMWAQQLFLKYHLRYQERYSLFFFLAANGLNPLMIPKVVLGNDVATFKGRPQFVATDYSDKSRRHVTYDMPKQLKEGRLFKGEKKVFDMVLGRAVTY